MLAGGAREALKPNSAVIAAAIAYFALFSLFPLALLIIFIASFIPVFSGGYVSNKSLMEQVQALIKANGVLPKEIAILSKLYAQMDHLEAEFLNHHLPYRVEGHEPFFKRSEIKTLLDYIRLGVYFHEPLNRQTINLFLSLANKPNRTLSRAVLEQLS